MSRCLCMPCFAGRRGCLHCCWRVCSRVDPAAVSRRLISSLYRIRSCARAPSLTPARHRAHTHVKSGALAGACIGGRVSALYHRTTSADEYSSGGGGEWVGVRDLALESSPSTITRYLSGPLYSETIQLVSFCSLLAGSPLPELRHVDLHRAFWPVRNEFLSNSFLHFLATFRYTRPPLTSTSLNQAHAFASRSVSSIFVLIF